MKIKTNIPNTLFFFDFFNPSKHEKIKSFTPKTLENFLLKHLRRWKNLLLKFLLKTAQRDGYL